MKSSDPSGCSRLHVVLREEKRTEPWSRQPQCLRNSGTGVEEAFSWCFPQIPALRHGPGGPVCVRTTFPIKVSTVLLSDSFYNILSGHFLPGRVLRENCRIHHKPFCQKLATVHIFVCKTHFQTWVSKRQYQSMISGYNNNFQTSNTRKREKCLCSLRSLDGKDCDNEFFSVIGRYI